jgi:transglutaminase-like putative cysteine protease
VWFRAFTYDRSFRAGHSLNVMQEFLAQRRGYCEQFAGTYAAFARVVGLPSRVAVGFTQGEQRDDGRYYVQGKHAHAWPEIYFDGVGWVPFEPTPGRANPAAQQYTGIEAGI